MFLAKFQAGRATGSEASSERSFFDAADFKLAFHYEPVKEPYSRETSGLYFVLLQACVLLHLAAFTMF